jgi:hypothetical protein
MHATEPEPRSRPRALVVALLMVGSLVCIKSFYDLGQTYGDFRIPQQAVNTIPEAELVFYAWYALFGALVTLFVACAAAELSLGLRLRTAFERACEQPQRLIWALGLLLFGGSLAFRRLVLEGQPIADDEATYLFVARTLLSGRLTNPPPADPDFFRNQFVVLNDHAWYGKYPIGHPLWLALGEALHVRDLMAPLAGALCVGLTYAVGRRFVSDRRALLGAALLCASPHFVWTCGTLLSQPTSCLTLLSGTWLLLRSHERDSVRLAALAGAVFGFGVLVRPLPGGLFAVVAGCAYLLRALRAARDARTRRWRQCAGFVALCGLGCVALLLVNYAQTGAPFTSGYDEAHKHVSLFGGAQGLTNSLFGALLRENFWLFGVPCSLAPVLLCRPRHKTGLWFGLIAAELAYRLVSPKTVVSTTGPIYMTEIVPLLTLAAADGLVRLGQFLSAIADRWRVNAATLVAAGVVAALSMFWPVHLQTARRGAELRSLVFRALIESHADRALVFADALVYPASGVSWAYFPDNPSPRLDDDILFVRIPKLDPLHDMQLFWQRRFADRRAFVFTWAEGGTPVFRELSARD